MAGLTQAARTQALQYLLTADTITRPTSWYVSLHTSGGEATTSTFASYARVSTTLSVTADRAETAAAVSWVVDAGAADFVVTGLGVYDAATGGTQLVEIPTNFVASAGDTIAFSAGNLATLLRDNC